MKKNEFKPFNVEELRNLTFGNVEGEEDNSLQECLILTNSIFKLFKNKHNYIIAPKGAGKSAIFKAYKDKMFKKEFVDYKKDYYIPINTAFIYDSKYLSKDKFKNNENYRHYILSWGMYIASILIKEIRDKFKDNNFYHEFKNNINKFENIKQDFQLFGLLDYINNFNLKLLFNINGNELAISPNIKSDLPKTELSLNELFNLINDFFKKNNLNANILIDKIDDFVGKEIIEVQKKYIQGLFDCIEEIHNFSNINPILFIRNDLFSFLDISKGYDKVDPRILKLEWNKDEILKLMISRFLSNQYIKNNYEIFLERCINDEFKKNTNKYKNLILNFKILFIKKNKYNNFFYKNFNYRIAEKFIKLFFPESIIHLDENNEKNNIDIIDWMFRHLSVHNDFINPRVIISFFNKLFENQYLYFFQDNPDQKPINNLQFIKQMQGWNTFEIFKQNVIEKSFQETKEQFIKTIFHLLKDQNQRNCFKKICEISFDKGKFNHQNIDLEELKINKEDYEDLISFLKLTGFLKEEELKNYKIPIFYRTKINNFV